MSDIPVLLMAAGASTRMGRPKQLLPWNKTTLIEHQIQTLRHISNSVFVILGAHSEAIIPVINKTSVRIMTNPNWLEGMGNSIAFGLQKLLEEQPDCKAVLIGLVDQPLIDTHHCKQLIASFEQGQQHIVVSENPNADWWGAPVLFDRYYFSELRKLNGDVGAKKIARNYEEHVIKVKSSCSLVDIDTPEAYNRLKQRINPRS